MKYLLSPYYCGTSKSFIVLWVILWVKIIHCSWVSIYFRAVEAQIRKTLCQSTRPGICCMAWFKPDFPCLSLEKLTFLPRGVTSMMSWRDISPTSRPYTLLWADEVITRQSKCTFLWFCWTARCKNNLSALSAEIDFAGTGHVLPSWPRWQEQSFDERLIPAGGTLWLCTAQRRGLAAASGARPRHAGVRENLSQWALNSWISPLQEEEQLAKAFQRVRKAKNTAAHS